MQGELLEGCFELAFLLCLEKEWIAKEQGYSSVYIPSAEFMTVVGHFKIKFHTPNRGGYPRFNRNGMEFIRQPKPNVL